MADIIKAIIIGLIQGLTEFFPVSSSGHIALAGQLLGANFDGGTNAFDLFLHVGTLIPLCIIFFKEILDLFKKPFTQIKYLIIASIPAVVVMFLIKFVFEIDEFPSIVIGYGYLVTAVVLTLTELRAKRITEVRPFTAKTAILMGLAQAVAVLPGVSRSGSTIAAGTCYGSDRETVAKFSFFMSMIVIGGSAVLQVLELITSDTATIDVAPTLFGMIAAAVSGFFAIKVLLRIVRAANYKWFSIYLVFMGIITLCLSNTQA